MGCAPKIFNRLRRKSHMSLQQTDVRVVANDLEIYFNGFEIALKRKQIQDAIRYLESMIDEIDYTSDRLQSQETHKIEIENRKRNIKSTIAEHRKRIDQLRSELVKL